MRSSILRLVLRTLQKETSRHYLVETTDSQLLKRYIEHRDETAFEAIVRLHGPMVLSLCERLLRNAQDAEDAFQATFLVLVRRAGSLTNRELLSNWLYGVAHRTALKARALSLRRHRQELAIDLHPEPVIHDTGGTWLKIRPILDAALQRLPDKYRSVVVLCDLENKRHEEAARQIGCPVGTVSSRLSRGRALMAKYLARRGVTLTPAALAAAVLEQSAAAAIPARLVVTTVTAATEWMRGAMAGLPLQSVVLAEDMLKTMFMTKLKAAALVFVTVLAIGVGAGALLSQAQVPRGETKQESAAGANIIHKIDALALHAAVADDFHEDNEKARTLASASEANRLAFTQLDSTFTVYHGVVRSFADAVRGKHLEENASERASGVWIVNKPNVRLELNVPAEVTAAELRGGPLGRLSPFRLLHNATTGIEHAVRRRVGVLFVPESPPRQDRVEATPFELGGFVGGPARGQPSRQRADAYIAAGKCRVGTKKLGDASLPVLQFESKANSGTVTLVTSYTLDPARGYLPVESTRVRNGRLSENAVLPEVRQCAGGRWYPMRVVYTQFRDDNPRGECVVTDYRVTSLNADQPPDNAKFAVQVEADSHMYIKDSNSAIYRLKEARTARLESFDELLAPALAAAAKSRSNYEKQNAKRRQMPVPDLNAGGKVIAVFKDDLKADDPLYRHRKTSYHKSHSVELLAEQAYVLELVSNHFSAYLVLETKEGSPTSTVRTLRGEQGGLLHLDDATHSLVTYRKFYPVPKGEGGTFRVVATSFDERGTGPYRLAVYEASPWDILEFHLKNLASDAPEEQPKLLEQFAKHLREKASDISPEKGNLAQRALAGFEQESPQAAAKTYLEFAALFSGAKEPEVKKLATAFTGAGRRLDLVGNPVTLMGKTLDGKVFDWSAYKGKVVLLEVWATWCVPCVNEMPNIRKMCDAYHGRGFEVVGINRDDDAGVAVKFLEKHGLKWANLSEAKTERGESFVDHYGMFTLPQSILLGPDGRVVSLSARGGALNRLLEKLLGPPQ